MNFLAVQGWARRKADQAPRAWPADFRREGAKPDANFSNESSFNEHRPVARRVYGRTTGRRGEGYSEASGQGGRRQADERWTPVEEMRSGYDRDVVSIRFSRSRPSRRTKEAPRRRGGSQDAFFVVQLTDRDTGLEELFSSVVTGTIVGINGGAAARETERPGQGIGTMDYGVALRNDRTVRRAHQGFTMQSFVRF